MPKGVKISKVNREQLKKEAWMLKTQGLGYRRIGDRLGIDHATAFVLVKEVLTDSIRERNLTTLEWRFAQISFAEEMVDMLAEHAMMDISKPIKGKKIKPKFFPNLEVIKEMREWKKFEADITGTKQSEVNLNLNTEQLAQKLREGFKLMDEAAGV